MGRWLFISVLILSCSKEDTVRITESPSTYLSHQFKDQLTAAQIAVRIGTYIPGAEQFLQTKYDVTVYRVSYKTHDLHNQEITASGLIYIPSLQYYNLPVISYQHGTALRKTEVPSVSGDVDYYIPFMLASETGAIVCEADYIGLGFSEGVHHFFEPTEEANAVIDLLRSTRMLFDKTLLPLGLTREIFLTGYSQGGHATLAAQRAIETTYNTEFNLVASAPMAGFFSFENSSQLDVLKDSVAYPVSGVYPYLVNSVNATQHVYQNLSSVFIPPYDSLSTFLFDGMHDADSVNAQFPEYIYAILQPSFRNDLKTNPHHPFLQAIKKYDVLENWIPHAPTHFYHSEGDEISFYDNSTIAYNTFKHKGGNVQLISLGHVSHLEGNILAIQKMRTWLYPLIHPVSYR